ncbi:MAG: hypothetical protein ACP5OV_08260 [Acidimicrobiales bacterium]
MRASRRVGCRTGWALAAALAVAAVLPAAPDAAAGRTVVRVVAPATVSANHPYGATVCWSNSPARALGEVETVGSGGLSWAVTSRFALREASGCEGLHLRAGVLGRWGLRAVVVARGRTVAVSGARSLLDYGTVSADAFWYAEFGCGDSTLTVSNGQHSFSAFCQLSAGRGASQPSSAQFRMATTCRSMTLTYLGTDNPPGDIGDTSVDTLSVLQSRTPVQTSTFDANVVTTSTFALDGSPVTISTWNNRGDFSESIYVIGAGSSAQCWTPTGTR